MMNASYYTDINAGLGIVVFGAVGMVAWAALAWHIFRRRHD